ncbi:hypothetical protein ASF70_13050 [Rhizobium sp. Leaf321]|nr:hypothetical protein ASF70_13050 [Rhizobium sp. Leaf321]
MTPIAGYDSWLPAVETYGRNLWADHAVIGSIEDFSKMAPMILRQAPDLIAGGPPCQDFSSAGKRKEGARADRTRDFAMLIAVVRPEWFIFENVKPAPRSRSYQDARSIWKAHSYGLTELILDASFYGVPQARERFFCVGRRGEVDGFLDADLIAAAAPQPMTLRDAFGTQIADAVYIRPAYKNRRALWGADEPAATVRNRYHQRVPPNYVRHPADAPGKITVLTQRMVSDIQGFPASWVWKGSKSADINQMLGNAVPPPLAKAIGIAIMDRHHGKTSPPISADFRNMLVTRKHADADIANILSRLKRARRMLGGRTYSDIHDEIRALEDVPEFKELKTASKSDLRNACRLHADLPLPPPKYYIPPKRAPHPLIGVWRKPKIKPETGYISRIPPVVPSYDPNAPRQPPRNLNARLRQHEDIDVDA